MESKKYFFKIEKGELIQTTEKDIKEYDYVIPSKYWITIIDKDKKVMKYLGRQILEDMIAPSMDSLLTMIILGIVAVSIILLWINYNNVSNINKKVDLISTKIQSTQQPQTLTGIDNKNNTVLFK